MKAKIITSKKAPDLLVVATKHIRPVFNIEKPRQKEICYSAVVYFRGEAKETYNHNESGTQCILNALIECTAKTMHNSKLSNDADVMMDDYIAYINGIKNTIKVRSKKI